MLSNPFASLKGSGHSIHDNRLPAKISSPNAHYSRSHRKASDATFLSVQSQLTSDEANFFDHLSEAYQSDSKENHFRESLVGIRNECKDWSNSLTLEQRRRINRIRAWMYPYLFIDKYETYHHFSNYDGAVDFYLSVWECCVRVYITTILDERAAISTLFVEEDPIFEQTASSRPESELACGSIHSVTSNTSKGSTPLSSMRRSVPSATTLRPNSATSFKSSIGKASAPKKRPLPPKLAKSTSQKGTVRSPGSIANKGIRETPSITTPLELPISAPSLPASLVKFDNADFLSRDGHESEEEVPLWEGNWTTGQGDILAGMSGPIAASEASQLGALHNANDYMTISNRSKNSFPTHSDAEKSNHGVLSTRDHASRSRRDSMMSAATDFSVPNSILSHVVSSNEKETPSHLVRPPDSVAYFLPHFSRYVIATLTACVAGTYCQNWDSNIFILPEDLKRAFSKPVQSVPRTSPLYRTIQHYLTAIKPLSASPVNNMDVAPMLNTFSNPLRVLYTPFSKWTCSNISAALGLQLNSSIRTLQQSLTNASLECERVLQMEQMADFSRHQTAASMQGKDSTPLGHSYAPDTLLTKKTKLLREKQALSQTSGTTRPHSAFASMTRIRDESLHPSLPDLPDDHVDNSSSQGLLVPTHTAPRPGSANPRLLSCFPNEADGAYTVLPESLLPTGQAKMPTTYAAERDYCPSPEQDLWEMMFPPTNGGNFSPATSKKLKLNISKNSSPIGSVVGLGAITTSPLSNSTGIQEQTSPKQKFNGTPFQSYSRAKALISPQGSPNTNVSPIANDTPQAAAIRMHTHVRPSTAPARQALSISFATTRSTAIESQPAVAVSSPQAATLSSPTRRFTKSNGENERTQAEFQHEQAMELLEALREEEEETRPRSALVTSIRTKVSDGTRLKNLVYPILSDKVTLEDLQCVPIDLETQRPMGLTNDPLTLEGESLANLSMRLGGPVSSTIDSNEAKKTFTNHSRYLFRGVSTRINNPTTPTVMANQQAMEKKLWNRRFLQYTTSNSTRSETIQDLTLKGLALESHKGGMSLPISSRVAMDQIVAKGDLSTSMREVRKEGIAAGINHHFISSGQQTMNDQSIHQEVIEGVPVSDYALYKMAMSKPDASIMELSSSSFYRIHFQGQKVYQVINTSVPYPDSLGTFWSAIARGTASSELEAAASVGAMPSLSPSTLKAIEARLLSIRSAHSALAKLLSLVHVT